MVAIIAKALAASMLLAMIAGCIGSVVQWRRMSFVGDSLAHSAFLGIGLSILAGIDIIYGLVAMLALFICVIHGLAGRRLPSDSALALFAHLTLAGGILLLYIDGSRVDWEGLLFGNVLALTDWHLALLVALAVVLLGVFWLVWPALVALAANAEIAAIEVPHRRLVNFVFLLMLGLYVALGVRLVGVLLLNALLIIPAAAARMLASSPLQMVLFAVVIGCLSAAGGIAATFIWDVPAAPACVLITGIGFLVALVCGKRGRSVRGS